MNNKEKQLFWDIINCPNSNKESSLRCACSKVLLAQRGFPFRQVPEPWSGQLDKASFMVIGSNPALVVKSKPVFIYELFPSKDNKWNNWQTINSFTWDRNDVENYFINRFAGAVFSGTQQPFVDITKNAALNVFPGPKIDYKKLNNDYWSVYNKYCKAIDPNYTDYSFVVTDFVHCKSGGETGVKEAMNYCQGYMIKIINLFLENGQPRHSILLFGSQTESAKKLNVLTSLGAKPVGKTAVVGNYYYKRKDVKDGKRAILMQRFSFGIGTFDVYYQIPAPSGQTRPSCCPVTFLGKTISW